MIDYNHLLACKTYAKAGEPQIHEGRIWLSGSTGGVQKGSFANYLYELKNALFSGAFGHEVIKQRLEGTIAMLARIRQIRQSDQRT